MRFIEVPAPLEARLVEGLASHVRAAVSAGAALHEQINDTAHDRALTNRTTSAILSALRPGAAPSICLLIVAMALVAHALFVRRVANRMVETHGGDFEMVKSHRD